MSDMIYGPGNGPGTKCEKCGFHYHASVEIHRCREPKPLVFQRVHPPAVKTEGDPAFIENIIKERDEARAELERVKAERDAVKENIAILHRTNAAGLVCIRDGLNEIDMLKKRNAALVEALRPFANYACDKPCDCANCRARYALAQNAQEGQQLE